MKYKVELTEYGYKVGKISLKDQTVIFTKIVEIRRIENSTITPVKELVTDVFMKFEAPDYSDEGVKAFFDTAINNQAYMNSLIIYGAYLGELLVGVIATRNEGNHIALFFCFWRISQARHSLGFEDTDSEQVVTGIRFIPMIYKK